MMQWSFEPIFGNWWLIAIVAAALLASLWLAPQFRAVTRGRRIVLTLLRILLILVLLVGLIRPGVVFTEQKPQPGAVAVLMDFSTSMTLGSDEAGKSRWQAQLDLWRTIEQLRGALGENLKIVPFAYDAHLRRLGESGQQNALFPDAPNGTVTDLGAALSEVVVQQTEPPLAGVLMIGDGTQTASQSVADPQQIARQMAQLDRPLFTVGLGPRGDADGSRDIAVENMPEHIDAYSKNEVLLEASVRARGLVGRAIPMQLQLIPSSDAQAAGQKIQLLAQPTPVPERSDQIIPLRLKFTVPEPGEYRLELSATPVAGELVTTNNMALCFLTVRGGGARILYLEGQPRQEQMFLRRSLNESPDLQIDFNWIQERLKPAWPVDLSKQLAVGQYDAIILGDLDSAALGKKQIDSLVERVAAGTGLITLGGFHSYDAGGYNDTRLAELLPVRLLGLPRQAFGAAIRPELHWLETIPMQLRNPHPITQLTADPENTAVWEKLRPLTGANRWGNLKVAPGVQLLAQGPNGQALLATNEYQNGRVLSFAGDSSWQWWRQGMEQQHKQFWRQALLWVLKRDQQPDGLSIALENRRLYRGDKTTFNVNWQPASANDPMPLGIDVFVQKEGQTGDDRIVTLNTNRKDERTLTGTFAAEQPAGIYQIVAIAKTAEGNRIVAQQAFQILENSAELSNPIPDWQMLGQLSMLTASAGGKMLIPEEVADTIKSLRTKWDENRMVTVQKTRLGDTVADSWIFLAFAAVLLFAEWGLRKRWQMV